MKPVFFLLLLLAACSSSRTSKTNRLASELVGEWRNTYLKITMFTHRNSDSTHVMEVTSANWEEKLKIQPVRTFFRSNGTYNSEHRNLKDSIFYNPAGYWKVVGDSIFMTDTFPKRGISYAYQLSITDNFATFRGVEDFDRDGKKDDAYMGVQKKQ